ncbi:MAG TPA: hypothetical protein VE553_01450 [Candidatus Binatia bacterium]|jgi:uncharacterized membrane protein YozB (DUF420 family)|nr:hypothetical protein [Candidatus Binatia bacterium]
MNLSPYDIVLILHSLLRWVVVIAGIVAAIKAIVGWSSDGDWGGIDRQLGLLFTISLDIQVLVGLILYFVLSPITTSNFSNFGEAMGNPTARFFLIEHIALMIVAVALAHIGSSLSRKAVSDHDKHRRAAIFYTLALIAILVGIPWAGRPLFRLG